MAEPVVPVATTPPNGAPPATPQIPAVPETPPAAAKPPETTAKPEPDERMGQRFAQISRATQQLAREKQTWARERATHDAEIKRREADLATRATQYEEWQKAQASALQDPGAYLRKVYGEAWYDRLTQYKLEGEKSPPADLQVEAIRTDLSAKLETERKAREDLEARITKERQESIEAEKTRARAEETALLQQFEADAVDYLQANAEKYELITLNEAQGLVIEAIKQTASKTTVRDEEGRVLKPGRVLSFGEASDLVEKHLEELEEKKLSASKKLQARGWTKAPPPKPTEPASDAARTLTNSMGTPGGSPSQGSADRYARAVAAMEAAEAGAAKA